MFKYLDKKFDEWHEIYFKEEKDKKLFSILVFAGFSSLMFKDLNQWIIFNFVFNGIFLTIHKSEKDKVTIKKEINFNELENDNNKTENIPKKEMGNELMLGNLFKK